ncbi:MAG TPA: ester cyclase [Candidatus Limnocylindria bacterium]|nr:ester cyclase [Candidatus Limnocylindria bacterium]
MSPSLVYSGGARATPAVDLSDLATRFFHGQDRLKGPFPPELLSPQYRAEIVGFPPMDAAGHAEFGRAFYTGFPDIKHNVDEMIVAGDRVIVRFTAKGTHTGSFVGIPATGRQVEIPAFVILTVQNDRVARLQAIFDQLGLMKLGVVPA